MRSVAIVGVWQETNTYSSRATTLAEFKAFELLEGEEIVARHRGTATVIGGFLDADEAYVPVPIFSAGAWPASPPDEETAHELLARLEGALERAPEVEAVLLNLHGAMVAAGAPDMELETVVRVRQRFGSVPVVAVLDLHANPSLPLVEGCDAIVGYRTYPHVDMADCGREAAALASRMVGGERLVTVLGRLACLTAPIGQATADEPMRGLLARAEERSREAGAVRVSLFPGFPYSDVDRAGFAVAAVTRAEDETVARQLVAGILDDVAAHLPAFARRLPDATTAVAEAARRSERPVILADVADNVGGGGPGDGTAILGELVVQEVDGAVVLLADPAAVAAAWAAGTRRAIDVELGGRSDRLHGDPVRARATVLALGDGRYRTEGPYMTGAEFSMGRTAVLSLGGVRVLTMEQATPPFHLEQLTSTGIDPASASIIALKGAVAWRAPYEGVYASFIEVDTPGVCPVDPLRLTRTTELVAIDPLAAAASR